MNIINVLTDGKEFIPDLGYLEKEAKESCHLDERIQFAYLDIKVQDRLKQEWIKYMKQIKSDFLFWSWFSYYLSKYGIDKLDNNQIEVNTSLTKSWKLEDLSILRSVHPPLQDFKVETSTGEITCSPFKKGVMGLGEPENPQNIVDKDDIRKVYQQNNYSNQILHTIAQQLDSSELV